MIGTLLLLAGISDAWACSPCNHTVQADPFSGVGLGQDLIDKINIASQGQCICVGPGDWLLREPVEINKRITIGSLAGNEETVLTTHTFFNEANYLTGAWPGVFQIGPSGNLTVEGLRIDHPEYFCKDKRDNDGNGPLDKKDPNCAPPPGDTAAPVAIPDPNAAMFYVEEGGKLTLRDMWMQGNEFTVRGSVIYADHAADILIEDSLFVFNTAPYYYAWDPSVLAPIDGYWRAGEGVIYTVDSPVTVTGSRFMHNLAVRGGVFFAEGGVLTFEDNLFRDNNSFRGGIVYGEGVDLLATNNLFCTNNATGWPILSSFYWEDNSGGVFFMDAPVSIDLHNNVFDQNVSSDYGGVLQVYGDAPIAIYQNTFVGNTANFGGLFNFEGIDLQSFTFWNNLVWGTYENAISAYDVDYGIPLDIEYNDFYETPVIFGGLLASQPIPYAKNIFENPQLLDYQPTAELCESYNFWPSWDSPLVDAGDPNVKDVGKSRSDIGAFGGPAAQVEDQDDDGWEDIYDCHDGNELIYPGATEYCDGLDNDCDGEIDEDQEQWYTDSDGDGFGDSGDAGVLACEGENPSGTVNNNLDCGDDDATVGPDLPELCDGIDNDCDGEIDEGLEYVERWPDGDGDGHGDPDGATIIDCASPAGYSDVHDDCDDTDDTIYPGADPVLADHIDQDCDGFDECYADEDGDGYGDEFTIVADNDRECDNASAKTSSIAGDCDDGDADTYPGAPEVAGDRLDQDCDGFDVCFADEDGDGYGGEGLVPIDNTAVCGVTVDGTADNSLDCDDTNEDVNPGAPEQCDGLDNNCNGEIDEGDFEGKTIFFLDVDGDGYGDATSTILACNQPNGYVTVGTDCNDLQPTVYPDAEELCDFLDNDCNTQVDDSATDALTYYADADGDGYGDVNTAVTVCEWEAPSGYVTDGSDCNDADAAVGSCGCEGCSSRPSGPGGSAPWLLAAGLAVAIRRREPWAAA